ncbi:MAG TPA: monovalent cation:proton antiporter-2 (CPA2) family protein [Azonexus sp.]|nr:monovalent cation:proton antiporter-2 (CPA2) family protein [Azonexus sp.]
MNQSWMQEAVVFLAAAVIAVPLFSRLGLGAVVGYLTAGMLIGPWLLGLVSDVEEILHVAELGVVLLLFVIGLELQPSRLWALRRPVFGLGGAQLLITGLLLGGAALLFGLPPAAALIVGLSMSLSSTALALKILAEKKQLTSKHGRTAFAILLFQDLAAIPLLAVLPLLGGGMTQGWDWFAIAKVVAVVGAVIVAGHWLLRPYLRLAATANSHEVFVAAALLVVVGTALIMQQAGLSMALGAFLAGVLLADSEYRHELEADIEPFKGLLLGLFFIAVGMSVDLRLVASQPLAIIGLTAGLMTVKALILYALSRLNRCSHGSAVNLALYISQGGEFAFVLFGVAAGANILDKTLADTLVVVVSLSMVVTPLLVSLNEKWLKIGHAVAEARTFDPIEPREHRVIIAGFGRFGQIIGRTLRLKNIPFTALEASFEQVDFVRKFGNKIHFGDASRLDLLRAAHADLAEVFVLAIDDIDASVRTAAMVRKHYPHLKIYARARNRVHAYRLMDIGVDKLIRETLLSSLELARDIFVELGYSPAEAQETVRLFRQHDEKLLARQHEIHEDEAQLIAASKAGAAELERLFGEDRRWPIK